MVVSYTYFVLLINKMKFMVTFNDRKKRIECHPSELDALIKSSFSIQNSNISLEVFDDDFNEYVEVDNVDDLADKSKLRVILLPETEGKLEKYFRIIIVFNRVFSRRATS